MSSVSKDFSKDLVNRIIISKQQEKHGAKMIWITIWIAIQRCTCLKGTFIVQYNKAHSIVDHCLVIVTSQST